MQFSVEISPDHPALPGHFPGTPVVPAVVLIERVALGLEEITGQPIHGVRQLRLLGLIEPGQRIDVEVREKTPDTWRLTCSVAGKPVAKGAFTSAPAEHPEVKEGNGSRSVWQRAEAAYERLPHAGSMQLIPELAMFENGAEATVTIAADHPLASGEGMPSWAALEYAAQLMACRKIFTDGEAMKKAVIVLVRSLERRRATVLAPGSDLAVQVMEEVAQPGAVQCRFVATSAGQWCARGEFTVLSEA